ncbi:MAG TPA: hypothetical protein VFK47_02390 [Ktedonobacteraceae bacterium]|nr:hypothetical protein [Ktedonobacteraceae bacterium]
MSTPTDQDANNQSPQEKATSDTSSSVREKSLLEVRGLSTGYGETQVLWDV